MIILTHFVVVILLGGSGVQTSTQIAQYYINFLYGSCQVQRCWTKAKIFFSIKEFFSPACSGVSVDAWNVINEQAMLINWKKKKKKL